MLLQLAHKLTVGLFYSNPTIYMTKKRINIMGSARGWEETPFDDGEVWAVNNVHIYREVDLVIDIHHHCLYPIVEKDKQSIEDIKKKGIPFMSREAIPGIPNSIKYPLEEISEEFDTDYFGSGIDYIIALAIYRGATEIHVYGVMMAKGSEYFHQKPSVEFWLGVAKGRRIEVVVHGESSILKTKNCLLYGYGLVQDIGKKQHPEQEELMEMLRSYEKEDFINENRKGEEDNSLFHRQSIRGRVIPIGKEAAFKGSKRHPNYQRIPETN